MIDLRALAELAASVDEPGSRTLEPLMLGSEAIDVSTVPVLMGTVNLSRDSTYRESIAVSVESALRKARVMAAEGARIIDIGAESSTAKAARVSAEEQIARLLPVIDGCVASGLAVSVETYEPTVVASALAAGAVVLNMTGVRHEDEMLRMAAEHGATVILCYSGGADVREITDVTVDEDPLPGLRDHFARRLDHARAIGVERLVIDPGMGFYYGNLTDPLTRARHQARVLLNGIRLRDLGVPLCNALPHAFDLFEEHFRSAESFFAVLAVLGGTGILRTHEVPQVRAVVSAMSTLSVN